MVIINCESQPPADGEVAELIAALRAPDRWQNLRDAQVDRIAELLGQRQPEPDGTIYEFIIFDPNYCPEEGGTAPSLNEAIDEGRHYLAQHLRDGPHILVVRRSEIVFTITGEDQ